MIIGITGGIGSGKSTIAQGLQAMGFAVYDTDREAKRLIVQDIHIRSQIEQLFGKEVFIDNLYQTKKVAKLVFADNSLLKKLNAIVHPAVKADIQRWSKQHPNTLCFVECAILFEASLDTICDKIIMVTAPEDMRIARTIKRDLSNAKQVEARIRTQDAEAHIHQCDLVVMNDGKTEITDICLQIQDFFCTFAD